MSLTLAQLRMLEAIGRTGGVGAAARALGISQPSVSGQLQQIEGRFRIRLFEREGHRLRPTATMAALLPRIHALLGLAGEVEAALEQTGALQTGRLTVGYSTHQFVMGVLSSFIALHPAVALEARSQASEDLLAMLRRGEVEAAFVTQAAPEAGLVAEELRRERVVLMAPAGHALAGRAAPLSWADVARLGLIRREAGSGTRRVFDAAALRAGVKPRHVLNLGSWESMRAAVIAGIGIGVALSGEIEAADRQIVALRIDDAALDVGHYLVCLPEMRDLAPVAALFDIARARRSGMP